MTIRSSTRTITFLNPFMIGDCDEVLPAGTYTIEVDASPEQSAANPTGRKSRKLMALIRLHETPAHRGFTRILVIDPDELIAAWERDKASSNAAFEHANFRQRFNKLVLVDDTGANRRAIERAENEGMVQHSK
ncbi:hypothetical protein [Aestuariispira ectoiniformans]|uniref:hypothetical protein n=1 Tax=Aestuariispira ectoiniformans TaxID=2775080 RepID=UPI00223B3F65|nr:hypothetical protein [Aestuariispira ectoiniformans]